MHDPQTLAWEIKNPYHWILFKLGKIQSYQMGSILNVWHVDPELRGSDDSCGWSHVRLSEERREMYGKMGEREYCFLYGRFGKPKETLELIHCVWSMIAWRAFKHRITPNEILRMMDLAYCPADNFQGTCEQLNQLYFDHKPVEARTRKALGITDMWESVKEEQYQYNSVEETQIRQSKELLKDLFINMGRIYETHHRSWYQHPRFHLFHKGYLHLYKDTNGNKKWRVYKGKSISNEYEGVSLFSVPFPHCAMRFQFPFLQLVRRWLFPRCNKCGGRFKWGQTAISDCYDPPSPRWYQVGDKHVYHCECDGSAPCKSELISEAEIDS